VSETPGEADYSLAKVPLQRGPVRPPPNIDEQGSLPYKPRQLSGMTRVTSGGGPLGRKRPVSGRLLFRLPLTFNRQIARSAENDP